MSSSSANADPTPKNPHENPALPHEHDESGESDAAGTSSQKGSRDVIRQAHDDIEEGQQDTDRYATPGLEKAHQRSS